MVQVEHFLFRIEVAVAGIDVEALPVGVRMRAAGVGEAEDGVVPHVGGTGLEAGLEVVLVVVPGGEYVGGKSARLVLAVEVLHVLPVVVEVVLGQCPHELLGGESGILLAEGRGHHLAVNACGERVLLGRGAQVGVVQLKAARRSGGAFFQADEGIYVQAVRLPACVLSVSVTG